jgi:uncharacterized membrane protein
MLLFFIFAMIVIGFILNYFMSKWIVCSECERRKADQVVNAYAEQNNIQVNGSQDEMRDMY